jgi:carbon storage regulator CsrA
MLVVSREPGSAVTIGDDIRVTVQAVPSRRRVKLGIEAPADMRVFREELAERPTKAAGAFRVIVVEDDPIHARLIQCGLKRAGVTDVQIETTGARALGDLIGPSTDPRTRPDLIVLDLKLPDLSGLDVLQRVRAHEPLRRIPVVMLSCSGSDSNIARCLDAGANAFMVKEPDGDRFRHEVSSIASFWRQARRVA